MNVLIVHNKYQLAGGEDTVAENEGTLLSCHGNHVIYYIRDNSEIKKASLLKKTIYAFESVFSIKSYKKIKELIKKNHIDVVHVHNTVPLVSFSCYYAAKSCGCRLVQSIHNLRMLCPTGMMVRNNKICEKCLNEGLHCAVKYACYRNSKIESAILAFSIWLHRRIRSFEKVDAYLVTTKFNKEQLSKIVDERKIFIKPYYSDSAVRDLKDKSREYYIFISRLEHLKGIQVALSAFRELPDLNLKVMGVGPDEEKSRQFAAENNMTNVEFLGFKRKNEMIELLYNAKALVFPTQWYEGFPMTIVESLAVGTPIIGSNIGNVGTIIENGPNGLTFQYDSAKDLARVIKRFEENPELARKIEDGAQSYFINNHSPELIYELTMKIYKDRIN